ncbi:pre-rRNA-processing protein TSR2 homolog [Drosophila grimshawi]|uniref:Pre-rRNA-processing protein TSR2 homolog n=1 Tax=Drosophila grimshawi TaxID=7222 RepID=B4JGJ8_DROGR|nr:pre-rRNA-processing protein TSR2 homolog [Drosophila grimshawi]EDV93695.1 GH19463 [Drosophila grimshawi]
MASSTQQTEYLKNFRLIVERIFNNWQNLRLAVEHGMGGRNGQQVAIQIMEYTYEYCVGNENITQGELQEVIEELMDQEFNTLCDDYSIPEICRNLLRYKQMALAAQYPQIEAELSKLPQGKDWLRPDVKITYTPIDGDSSSGEDMDDEDADDVGMSADESDEENAVTAASSSGRVTRSQTRKQQADEFVEPEDGWTTVRRK